jgi:hypothetical protein
MEASGVVTGKSEGRRPPHLTPPNEKKEKIAETNPSVARYKENTKEIRSILRPTILRLFLGPLVVWPKV